jgi:ankyrin repeat protein
MMIDCGADVNIRTDADVTSLHFAARNANVDALKSLLQCQVDTTVVNKIGTAPIAEVILKYAIYS